jgi:hypothetical protein
MMALKTRQKTPLIKGRVKIKIRIRGPRMKRIKQRPEAATNEPPERKAADTPEEYPRDNKQARMPRDRIASPKNLGGSRKVKRARRTAQERTKMNDRSPAPRTSPAEINHRRDETRANPAETTAHTAQQTLGATEEEEEAVEVARIEEVTE